MKTTLPKRSLIIKERLERIVEEILSIKKDKMAMIILFGSYARGDWVQDIYVKDHITYSYQSDIDLLLILKKGKYNKYTNIKIEEQIEKRLERKSLMGTRVNESLVTLVLESITVVNNQLEKGHYFFSDIKKEGILLYDNKEFVLSDAKELSLDEREKIAKEDYNYWFYKGSEFFNYSNDALQKFNYNFSAFFLHQATESFYNAILLVFSGYKPKLHDIKKLGKLASSCHSELLKVFYFNTSNERKCFELLRNAYIEARYDKNYTITNEQLEYLTARVNILRNLTQNICLKFIQSISSSKN